MWRSPLWSRIPQLLAAVLLSIALLLALDRAGDGRHAAFKLEQETEGQGTHEQEGLFDGVRVCGGALVWRALYVSSHCIAEQHCGDKGGDA
jgi:hypothetical protein